MLRLWWKESSWWWCRKSELLIVKNKQSFLGRFGLNNPSLKSSVKKNFVQACLSFFLHYRRTKKMVVWCVVPVCPLTIFPRSFCFIKINTKFFFFLYIYLKNISCLVEFLTHNWNFSLTLECSNFKKLAQAARKPLTEKNVSVVFKIIVLEGSWSAIQTHWKFVSSRYPIQGFVMTQNCWLFVNVLTTKLLTQAGIFMEVMENLAKKVIWNCQMLRENIYFCRKWVFFRSSSREKIGSAAVTLR